MLVTVLLTSRYPVWFFSHLFGHFFSSLLFPTDGCIQPFISLKIASMLKLGVIILTFEVFVDLRLISVAPCGALVPHMLGILGCILLIVSEKLFVEIH